MHLLKPRPCIWVLFLPAQLLCTNDREQGFSYKGTTIHRIVKGLYPMVILIFFKLIVGAIIVLFVIAIHITALFPKNPG